jgi:hypothetical protein
MISTLASVSFFVAAVQHHRPFLPARVASNILQTVSQYWSSAADRHTVLLFYELQIISQMQRKRTEVAANELLCTAIVKLLHITVPVDAHRRAHGRQKHRSLLLPPSKDSPCRPQGSASVLGFKLPTGRLIWKAPNG